MSVEDYISTLKRLTGTRTDKELAERLGVAKQTISAWRTRGAIPHKQEVALAEHYGPEAAFSTYVRFVYSAREQRVLQAVFLTLFEEGKHHLSPSTEGPVAYLKWAGLFAEIQDELRSKLREYGFVELEPSGDVSIAEEDALVKFLLALLKAGKIETYNDAFLVLANDEAWRQ